MSEKFIYNDSTNLGPDTTYLLSPAKRAMYFSLDPDENSWSLESIWAKFANRGSPSGTVTLEIYEAIFNGIYGAFIPTGPVLATGSISQSSIVTVITGSDPWPTSDYGQLYLFELSASVTMTIDRTYIVTFQASGSGVNAATAILLSLPPANFGPHANGRGSIYTGFTWQSWIFSNIIFQAFGTEIIPVVPPTPTDALPEFPASSRPDGYAPDDFWIPGEWNGGVYTPPEFGQPTAGRYFATGGGRWSQQLIAIGHGKVYYEELT